MNSVAEQLDLFTAPSLPSDPDARALVNYLFAANGWRTRADIERDLGFDDRRSRSAREAAGSLVIIGHKGFRHSIQATPEERGRHLQFFEKQGLGMLHVRKRDADFFRTLGCEVLAPELEEVPS